MGTAVSVKQLLKSVCDDTRWNYAVFWRLIEDGSTMLLSWADGFWDYPNSHTGASLSKNSMELISGCLHTYGEGIVGRVASTGTYSWIFLDNVISEENFVGTWHLHFGTGIKTVLLVPIFPHGVVQLGSLDVMLPDPVVVGYVKNLFMLLEDFQDRQFSMTSYGEELSMFSGLPDMNQTKVLMNDASSHAMPVMASMFPVYGFDIKQSQEDIQCFVDVLGVNPTYDDDSMDLGIGNETIDDISVCKFSTPECEIIHHQPFDEFSAMTHPWEGYQEQESNKDSAIFANNTSSPWDAVEQPHDDRGGEIMDDQVIDCPLSFDIEAELQAVFAPAAEAEDEPLLWTEKSQLSEVGGFFQPDFQIIDPFLEEYFTEASTDEPVLVASVANTDSSSEDDISFTVTDEKTPPKPQRKTAKSWQMVSECDQKSAEINILTRQSHVAAEPFCAVSEAPLVSCPSGSSEKNASTVINGEAHKFDVGHSSFGKCPKSRKPDGRKGRKADVQRRRPRDRQMIQDRIKQLREIVPGGEKCSIDALLERAANHMHFLRSVTSQAEKLSKCRQSKEVHDEKLNKTPPSDSNRGGFAQRTQPEFLPITVENLDHPEHILVEVLCEEQSLFLEIAQVIRRLKLTILEGVMETRSDHKWACFIVETPRGFQQVEIVWPLILLLQTKRGMRLLGTVPQKNSFTWDLFFPP